MTRAIAIRRLTSLALPCVLATVAACGGKPKPVQIRAPNVILGECVDPKLAGVLSDSPNLKAAHRDLNGDNRIETVLADKALCRHGNCYWNLLAESGGCSRYIGTIAGAAVEVLEDRADGGFRDLRGWWKLPTGGRQLVQSYRFRESGYRLVDVLVCRQDGDDGLLCASEEPASDISGHF